MYVYIYVYIYMYIYICVYIYIFIVTHCAALQDTTLHDITSGHMT